MDCPELTTLYLIDNESEELTDSIIISDGIFHIDLFLSRPQQFTLQKERNSDQNIDKKTVWLEASDIEITGSYDSLSNIEITGSTSHSRYIEYQALYKKNEEAIDRHKLLQLFKDTPFFTQEDPDSLQDIILSDYQGFIKSNPESPVSFLALSELNMILGKNKEMHNN